MHNDERYGDTPQKEKVLKKIEELSHLDEIEFALRKKKEAKEFDLDPRFLTKMVEQARHDRQCKRAQALQEQAAAERAIEAERLPEHWAVNARELIECEDVLSMFAADWGRLIAGEDRVGKLLYLVGTSRLLDKPLNAAIKGESAGGKSEARKTVLRFFPPEDIVHFTSMSERALIYMEDDFPHKILSMGEAVGADEQSLQDYFLRELMSEGHLVYHVAQRVGDNTTTVKIEKHGPVSFLVTTTRRKLHPENETRMLSLDITDTEQQTRAVMAKIAQLHGLNEDTDHVDFEVWQDFQRWLAVGPRRVVVPYASDLAALIPPKAIRLRRDFHQLIHAIKAHALLHRQHRERRPDGVIVADLDHDYPVVRDLMHDLLLQTAEAGLKETVVKTLETVEALTANLALEEGVTAKDVGKHLRLNKSSALRRLYDAQDAGVVVTLEEKRGRPGRFRPTGEMPESVQMLPHPEALGSMSPLNPDATAQPRNQAGNGAINQMDNGCEAIRNQDATSAAL